MTTREYAQTTELLSLHGIEHDVVGPRHGGASAAGKARAMGGRLRALRSYARRQHFDIALAHASHELPMVARSLGVPSSYAFDYEFARTQHGLGCRTATRVVVPDAIPQSRLDRLGARVSKVRRYPGLKEEYYLHGFVPDPIRARRARDRARARARRRADATRGVAVPPARQSALRRRARAARARPTQSMPSSCREPTSSERLSDRRALPVTRRARARDRRPEPRRALGPRRFGGRDDEP